MVGESGGAGPRREKEPEKEGEEDEEEKRGRSDRVKGGQNGAAKENSQMHFLHEYS